MRANRWISAEELLFLYSDTKISSLYSRYLYEKHWRVKINHKLYFNETYLIRFRKFRDDLYLEAQEMYYAYTGNIKSLAVLCSEKSGFGLESNWRSFFYKDLFKSTCERSIVNTMISKYLIKFVRIMRRYFKLHLT